MGYVILFVGAVLFLAGLTFGYLIGGFNKCDHQFEEVLNTINHGKHTVVYMCKKCGKRKITKV